MIVELGVRGVRKGCDCRDRSDSSVRILPRRSRKAFRQRSNAVLALQRKQVCPALRHQRFVCGVAGAAQRIE